MQIVENIKELYSSISIPSTVHSYSIGVEYMRQWFLNKFNKDYFKTVHIDGKHVFDDFRTNPDITSNLKKLKPSVAIIPQLEFEFNRDNVDLYQFGIKNYSRRSKLESSFFKDKERNMYLGVALEQLQMNFTYRIRLSSRAQQIDLYKFIQMAFRTGSTQGEYIDVDFHIPYNLMIQVAKDAGFEVKNDRIVNTIQFVSYLNAHSIIPILFKYRTINGKSEFFLRFKEMYMHIDCTQALSADDGEREGMLQSNFMIDMNVVLKMPTTKMFMYYSCEEHDSIQNVESADNTGIGLFSIKIPSVPEKNEKGWNEYLSTEYYEEDITKPLTIHFAELFEGSDIEKLIRYNKNIHISPLIFIDFKLFNNGEELKYTIDWDNMILSTNMIVNNNITNISVYTDLDYMSKQLINMDELYKDRFRILE